MCCLPLPLLLLSGIVPNFFTALIMKNLTTNHYYYILKMIMLWSRIILFFFEQMLSSPALPRNLKRNQFKTYLLRHTWDTTTVDKNVWASSCKRLLWWWWIIKGNYYLFDLFPFQNVSNLKLFPMLNLRITHCAFSIFFDWFSLGLNQWSMHHDLFCIFCWTEWIKKYPTCVLFPSSHNKNRMNDCRRCWSIFIVVIVRGQSAIFL